MQILILGSGGREHALAWKIAQSPRCSRLFIAPGNAGTSLVGENIELAINDFEAVGQFVQKHGIDMVVVGPEEPLVRGIADYFADNPDLNHVLMVGPRKAGAALEGSKAFAKEFMVRHGIPTARYRSFTKETLDEGKAFLETFAAPYVLKADGLAAGKGVIICETLAEATQTLEEMLLEEPFGEASATVVVEEFLQGIELSVFALTDGHNYRLLPSAKDYKRVGEKDSGPNTGGMGAVSPVPFAGKDFMDKVEKRIVIPTIEGLKKENIPYCGFLFFGLMNVEGDPYVIEYNARLGDPETEAILPRILSDLVSLFEAAAKGTLHTQTVEIMPDYAATVVLVSGGYPGPYEKGFMVTGLENVHDSLLFYAGLKGEGQQPLTSGGRVIAITSLATELPEALKISYHNASLVDYMGKYYRRDIGKDLLAK
ncbi:MAG: phosphoribosylamine--glycine ligase [Bacteroides sp.]|nr:phosphoribosylamine--glycine ligase [Bacteroides sp.]